jgi:transglutaminase-like putative cysteine protease
MAGRPFYFALLAGGVILTAGSIYYLSRRRGKELGRSFEPVEIDTDEGYKLTAYRSARMPIKERMDILQDLTAKSIRDPRMRKIALQITRHCPARDGACEARAIYNWIKSNVRYTGDVGPHALHAGGPVEGVDLFQSAYRTVEFGGGDCDDHSILACTVAALNGLTCKYRVTSPNRRGGDDDFTHIYPMIGVPKENPRKFVAIDTTLPGRRYGSQAPYGRHVDFAA